MRLDRTASRILLTAFLLAASVGHAAAQIGRVGGVVKDENGQAIKGATISAENNNIGQSLTATTDDKGRFSMIGLRSGPWKFIAQAPGYLPESGQMPVRMGAPNPPISFTLYRSTITMFGALGGISGKELQADLAAADALYDQQQWDEALASYRRIAEKSSALSIVNLQIAAVYRNKKDYASALAAYEKVIEGDPDNEKARVGIAMTAIERGDEKAAEEALLGASSSPKAGREVFFNLGELKFTRNETDEAARWYEKAAAADPFWGKPLYKLGLCAMKRGDADAAGRMMAQVIAVDPVSPEAELAKSFLETSKK